MKITIIGTGYVGLVTGTCLAHAGHQVVCVDNNKAKVTSMQAGVIPIYEPGLEPIFTKALTAKKLRVTSDLRQSIEGAEVIFLALPTPPGADGAADLSAVLSVAEELGSLLSHYTVIVNKSTVPVGTGEQVSQLVGKHATVAYDVVSNPEFLREGYAVEDFMHPDRVVVGTTGKKALRFMEQVYEPFITDPAQLVHMDIRSAEMTKYAANSFLAMKVSFMNEIANLCEKVDANVDSVRLGIGPDTRIGRRFLFAGIGFGGSCFPKDVQALLHTARSNDYGFRLLESIIAVNASQKLRLAEKVEDYYGHQLSGKRFAIWGLAFKPDTDDIRESPALFMIDRLLQQGASIMAYDPQAMSNTKLHYGQHRGLRFANSALAAAKEADALLIVTEWGEFLTPDFEQLKQNLKAPVIFDGRNLYHPAAMKRQGFHYESIGRQPVDGIGA